VGIGKDASNFSSTAASFFENFFLIKPISNKNFFLPYLIFMLQVFKSIVAVADRRRRNHKGQVTNIVFHPQIPTKRTAKYPTKNTLHVVRIHDLFPITNPEWFPFGVKWIFLLQLRLLSLQNTLFVCNSKFTFLELQKILKSENKIYILECLVGKPAGSPCENCRICTKSFEIPPKFALTVGTLEPRKNFDFISKNWDGVWNLTKIPLIIAGGDGWKLPQLKNSLPSVHHLGKVCDSALNQLYEIASLYIAGSKSEGFDMPFHEASLYGIPVLASDIQVHKEFGVALFALEDSQEFVSMASSMILNQIPAISLSESTTLGNYLDFWKAVSNRLALET